MGAALMPVPTLNRHTSSRVWSSSATMVPSSNPVNTRPPAVDSIPDPFG